MQSIVIVLFSLVFDHFRWLIVVNTEHVVPEAWYHKELLQHAIHVANTAEIPDTHV